MSRLSFRVIAGALAPALVIALQAALTWAQGTAPQGLYRGSVQEAKNGRPTPEAILLFTDKNSGVGYMAVSNEQGEYQIHVPRGVYTLVMMIEEKTYEPEDVARQGDSAGWSMTFAPVGKGGLSEQQIELASDRQEVTVQRAGAGGARGARKIVTMEVVTPPPADIVAQQVRAEPEGETAPAADAGTAAEGEPKPPVVIEVAEQPPQVPSAPETKEAPEPQAEPHLHADLETLEAAAPAPVPPLAPPVVIDPAAINAALGKAYFDFNKYDLRDDAGAILTKAAILLEEEQVLRQPDLWLQVEGHCDEIGSDAYNDRLGQNRADAARNLLVSEGLPGEKIRTVSYGRRCLLEKVAGTSPANRRVELRVVSQSGVPGSEIDSGTCPAQ
jgi:peptidoglycan-associated lipoprotein